MSQRVPSKPSKDDGARPVDLVVITGYSGAGKSEAIAAFEDGGYFCVDNLPPRMIGALGELFRHQGSGVRRAAIVSDVRGGDYFEELIEVLGQLEHARSSSWRRTRRRSSIASRRLAAAIRWPPTAGWWRGSEPSAGCSARCASAPTW
jgi:P-loop ATPase protein family